MKWLWLGRCVCISGRGHETDRSDVSSERVSTNCIM